MGLFDETELEPSCPDWKTLVQDLSEERVCSDAMLNGAVIALQAFGSAWKIRTCHRASAGVMTTI